MDERVRSWTPWSQAQVVTLAANAHEQTVLDLKSIYELGKPVTRFEIAKDLAAFANALGGTVLVGANERLDESGRKTGRIQGFAPIPDVNALMEAARSAAGTLCRPALVVEPAVLRLTPSEQAQIVAKPKAADVELVALNVKPLDSAPSGVACCDPTGTQIENAYRFPIRVLDGTTWLRPEELAFYMNSHERRMFLRLQQLQSSALVLWDKGIGRNVCGGRRPCRLISLDAERSFAVVEFAGDPRSRRAHIPLTFVNAVWIDQNDKWNIDVNGDLGKDFVPFGSAP